MIHRVIDLLEIGLNEIVAVPVKHSSDCEPDVFCVSTGRKCTCVVAPQLPSIHVDCCCYSIGVHCASLILIESHFCSVCQTGSCHSEHFIRRRQGRHIVIACIGVCDQCCNYGRHCEHIISNLYARPCRITERRSESAVLFCLLAVRVFCCLRCVQIDQSNRLEHSVDVRRLCGHCDSDFWNL